MNQAEAQSAVSISAMLVGLIFAYRKLTENSSASISSGVPATGHFVIGFGFTYVVLSIIAQSAPALGGMFAVLVATGDLLVNGQPLIADLQTGLGRTTTAAKTTTTAANEGG